MYDTVFVSLYATYLPSLQWNAVGCRVKDEQTYTQVAKALRKEFCEAKGIKHPSMVAWIVCDGVAIQGNILCSSANFDYETYCKGE